MYVSNEKCRYSLPDLVGFRAAVYFNAGAGRDSVGFSHWTHNDIVHGALHRAEIKARRPDAGKNIKTASLFSGFLQR
jgi:hypothetical protein